jgi:two-component system, LytTR family, response regulator
MRALLVDDEIRSLETLATLITDYCPEIEIVRLCESIESAYEQISVLKPDIVFLDVAMPPRTGFDLLRKYEELPFEVIFVTAFDHYSIEAIKFSALYYLLKPVKIDDLKAAVKKAQIKIYQNQPTNTRYFHSIQGHDDIQRLVINSNAGADLVELADIIYIEARNSYSMFHLANGKSIISTRSIKEYEQMLTDKGFFRIHKSYIVNVGFVISISKTDGDMVILKNNERLPLAYRRKEAFLKYI